MFGISEAIRRVFEQLREVASSDSPVIVEGETGTGKELAGKAIHDLSPRADGPFVVVDCASIPEGLVESELFGHIEGAFTGAVSDRIGAFQAASRGSIFIDEIGELPLTLQPKLLRVLEQREVRRIGAAGTQPIDVRIIAATNRDLAREVKEGRFREDLYFRLAVVQIHIPPLRERRADILFLAERFLDDLPTETGERLEIDEDTRRKLLEHPWPGNVRELRNVIDRGAVLSDRKLRIPDDFTASIPLDGADGCAPGSGAWLDPMPHSDIPAAFQPRPTGASVTRVLWEGRTYKEARAAVLTDFERGYLVDLLEKSQGNVSAAARAAGIHRNILHRMMVRYGITKLGS